MRHIMIGLFASPLGHSCANLISTTFPPNLKDQSPPTFCFCPQDYILTRPFQKRGPDCLASRSWNLCASLLIDTTSAPADAKLCKDADVSRRSFHCHYILPIYFEQMVLYTQPWTAAFFSDKPSTEFT
jgi:hypothetical protein